MPQRLVAVSDSVFPNLDLARAVVARVGAELRLAAEPTTSAILEVARDADALMVTYFKITAEMIREMKRCKIISRFGIGVDNVDLAAATAAGIVVTKVPDYCIDEVSDHAMALLLSLVRKIPFSSARAHAGRWEMPAVVPIHRLRGTVLGLVGFGRIPQLVAPKAKSFGLRVVTFDPYVPQTVLDKAGVERVEFADLLKNFRLYFDSHAALAGDRRHLFNADVFRQMKPGAVIVNTSRGPVVDEAALCCGAPRCRTTGRRGARCSGAGAADQFAAVWPRQCDSHAPHKFLFGRSARRVADESGGRSGARSFRRTSSQSRQSGSARVRAQIKLFFKENAIMSNQPWKTDKWFTSPWNYDPAVRKDIHFPKQIKFHDITLRDGEQQTGVIFTKDDKIRIAERLWPESGSSSHRGGHARRVAER